MRTRFTALRQQNAGMRGENAEVNQHKIKEIT